MRFVLTLSDLARTRFAISPMWDLVISLRALRVPADAALHAPWVQETRERLRDVDLDPLLALVPLEGYIPDFITPPPSTPLARFEDELEQVCRTPAADVRREVGWLLDDQKRTPALQAYLDHPRKALNRLGRTLERYWQVALEPAWPRVRALLDEDLRYRARRLTEKGPAAVFDDLHPMVHHGEGVIEVQMDWDRTVELAGRGLLLVPSAFAMRPFTIATGPWQPTLLYPARGIGLLWEPPGECAPEALAGVIGQTRARLLMALDAPRPTNELARRAQVTPGGASQHLAALHAAGLVTRQRNGRSVLYARTRAADALVGAQGAA